MELLDVQAYWQAVSAHGPDTIVGLDRDGVIRFINRVPPHLDKDKVVGAHFSAFISAEQRAWLTRELERCLAKAQPYSYEIMIVGPNETQAWYACRMVPLIKDGTTTGALIISHDINDKKEREAQLAAADRMASVGILATGVANDINNPLAVLISHLDQALTNIVSAPEAAPPAFVDGLRAAREAADRVRFIVRDLKLFLRSAEPKQVAVEVHHAIESALRVALNDVRPRARLVKIFSAIPPVLANEARLSQALLSLIVNAAQAIVEGEAERNEIRIVTRMTADGMIAIDIIDSGAGMSEDVQKRIFMPFFTTKGVGTGLGLSIAQGIVRSFGGEIRVHSREGMGSTFTLLLRVAADPRSTIGQTVRVMIPVSRRGHILVVDEPSVSLSVRRSLEEDHSVEVVDTAGEALAKIRAGERFDIILSALLMPHMTGMELYGLVREIDANQADSIIFMTGGEGTESARELLERVSNICIEKPFDVHDLRAIVAARLIETDVRD